MGKLLSNTCVRDLVRQHGRLGPRLVTLEVTGQVEETQEVLSGYEQCGCAGMANLAGMGGDEELAVS